MKIAMFTNTYAPHVGGVAKSIQTLEDAYRAKGHEVCVIAPDFGGSAPSPQVLRVPAIRNFHDSGFCVRLPIPTLIREFVKDFAPDIVHSHHPFLLGDAALREGWKLGVPIVFTHHTLYERYTHYVPMDSDALKRIAIQISTEYCNLCDTVIAPSRSIARLLVKRGVLTPVEVIPTGIDTLAFGRGRNRRFRQRHGIPMDAKVIGHVGRLAHEKNLAFLAEAVETCLAGSPDVVFLLVGEGDCRQEMLDVLRPEKNRVFHPGTLSGDDLADAYAAIDCFAFSSQSETQGMVLAEAMAAGTPVVALDGPGVREILADGENGILLDGGTRPEEFSLALRRLVTDGKFHDMCAEKARETAMEYDQEPCVNAVLDTYRRLIDGRKDHPADGQSRWDRMITAVEIEWNLLAAKAAAAAAGIVETPATEATLD